MTSKRSYRDPIPQQSVRGEIVKGAGTQFDPKYAKIMQHLIDLDTEYEMKEKGIDEAYTSAFWLNSAPEALDLTHIEAEIEDEALFLHFRDFDYTLKLPLGYMRKLSGIDPGVAPLEDYEKKIYVDPDRPMIALTYDDGPYQKVDAILFETFNRYGESDLLFGRKPHEPR